MRHRRLGQHWLFDKPTLQAVIRAGAITSRDVVLEVGPGLGTLTELLAAKAKQVIAVEKDEKLALDLKRKLSSGNLEVVADDILQFDLRRLPQDYKVVANIPYYLTSNLLRVLLESPNPPAMMSLLMQKEVAERVTASPAQMSTLSVSVQYYSLPAIVQTVPRKLFSPPPEVDSAIVQIKRRAKPFFNAEPKRLFRLVKAGFSAKRKQLKNALAGGLHIPDDASTRLLNDAGISPGARAQELSLKDWQRLYAIAVTANII